jgi:hypothetical protein
MTTLAYTPSVEDVARHLRARTRDTSGAELGTFTDETVPTDEQVTGIIDMAMPFVSGMLGPVPEACEWGARSLAALKAAEMVEISYFPEQLQPGGTVSALRALYADLLPSVQACVSSGGEGGGGGADGDSTPPSSCFWDIPYEDRAPATEYRGGRWVDGRDPVEIVVRVIDPNDPVP